METGRWRRLAGRVALVTGAARGIGAAAARRFAAEGARVVVADVLDDHGGAAADADEAGLRLAFDVNVLGPALGTAACVPGMRAAGGGAIVFVSSIASITGGGGFVPYASSKAANATYARCAARELGPFGIRVNALHPGGVETPMNSGPDFGALDRDGWFGRMAIPRIGQPDEIADALLYLVSDDSSYVTGTSLVVDGGQVLGPVTAWASPGRQD